MDSFFKGNTLKLLLLFLSLFLSANNLFAIKTEVNLDVNRIRTALNTLKKERNGEAIIKELKNALISQRKVEKFIPILSLYGIVNAKGDFCKADEVVRVLVLEGRIKALID